MRWAVVFLSLSIVLAWPGPAQVRGHAAPPAAAAEPDPATPDEVFEQMGHSFRTDRAKGQHLRYQFNFGDPQGGHWWIEIADGAYTMGKGMTNHPDVTFTCSGGDWVKLSNGKLSGWMAFLTGRLHISGSQRAARKLDDIFP